MLIAFLILSRMLAYIVGGLLLFIAIFLWFLWMLAAGFFAALVDPHLWRPGSNPKTNGRRHPKNPRLYYSSRR